MDDKRVTAQTEACVMTSHSDAVVATAAGLTLEPDGSLAIDVPAPNVRFRVVIPVAAVLRMAQETATALPDLGGDPQDETH